MKKILVVQVNWLGDVIFSSPIFKALKTNYPEAYIACLAVPRVKNVLEQVHGVDEIIVYDEKGRDWGLLAKWKLVKRLKREGFDCVFILHGSKTRALLMFLARIPLRVGYDIKKRSKYLTHIVKPLPGKVHRRDHYLNVIESFGVKVTDRATQLKVDANALTHISNILGNEGIHKNDSYVVVHVGGNWDLKRWPKEYFVHLINRLQAEKKLKVVIPGTNDEKNLAEDIAEQCIQKPVVLSGATNFNELLALMKGAVFVISNDSGPLHVASSVGTKTIGLFGPTDPAITGPVGLGENIVCRTQVGCNETACYYLDCPDNSCMKAISVKKVMHAVE